MQELKRLYVEDQEKEQYFHDYRSKRDLKVLTIENGYIFPALDPEQYDPMYGDYGVRDSKKNFVPLSSMRSVEYLSPYYDSYNEPAEYVDKKIIYCGVAYFFQYGHFLLESLSRLWYVLKHTDDQAQIAFIPIGSIGKYAEFFELLGIPMERIIFVDRPMQFAEIIIPEISSEMGEAYTEEFLTPYRKMMDSVSAGKHKKIYLTRRKFAFSGLCGEKSVEKLFKVNGYKIIVPEEHSVKEQVALIKGADSVVSFLGSATHNAVFAQEGTEFIILNRADNICPIQMLINQAKKLDYYYVDAYFYCLPTSYFWGPALVGSTQYMKAFFKDRGYVMPEQKFGEAEKLVSKYLEQWFSMYGYSEKIFGRLVEANPAAKECFSYDFLHHISMMINYKKNKKELCKNKRHYARCLILSKMLFGKKREKYAKKTLLIREKIKRLERETML